MEVSTKTCTCCLQELDLEKFYIRNFHKNTRTSWCKKCTNFKKNTHAKNYVMSKEVKERRNKRSKEFNRYNRFNVHGITEEYYKNLLEKQNHCCAICRKHSSIAPMGKLVIDHCHETGKVRGLLCNLCNTALGYFKDSPENMLKGAEYITSFLASLEQN